MKLVLILLFGFGIGYVIGNFTNPLWKTKQFLKKKLHDLIDHNLAIEKGYKMEVRKYDKKPTKKEQEKILNPKDEDFKKHLCSKYIQQEGKIIFASGLLRDMLDNKRFVDYEWERYGMKFLNNDVVYKVKIKEIK